MPREFRMMPKQGALKPGYSQRYGFLIPNHPRGVPHDGQGTKRGDYIASWGTHEEAAAAAICLGIDTHQVQGITAISAIPDGAGGWSYERG